MPESLPPSSHSRSDTAALEIHSLCHAFGAIRVLQDVDISIDKGDFTVLLGLNGAGKTTLYSLITRLYVNHHGSIRIFGFDLLRHAQQALSHIGVVFQQPTLDLDLSVRQNLRYHCRLHGIAGADACRRIDQGLERIQLLDVADRKARHLSGGQRRRIEIARALLHRPQLLLLDEPSVGLDIDSRADILAHVRRLCREEKLAVLWATHLIDEVDPQGRVIILHRGSVLAAGTSRDFLKQEKTADVGHAFTRCIERADRKSS